VAFTIEKEKKKEIKRKNYKWYSCSMRLRIYGADRGERIFKMSIGRGIRNKRKRF
jgi:hypothetical protein